MLIVFSGKARSGKDTAAEHLQKILLDKYHIKFNMIAYADDLKERVMRDFGLSREHVYGDLKEEPITHMPIAGTNMFWTARKLLQFVGTDVYRAIDPDFWVKQVQKVVYANPLIQPNFIITDGRFPNEVDWVAESSGLHFRIDRSEHDLYVGGTKHASETSLDGIDMSRDGHHLISNSGTLGDFYNKIEEEILEKVLRELLPRAKQTNGGKNG